MYLGFVSEGGLELASEPCRMMPSSARSACYPKGFGERRSQCVSRRAVRYPGVFRTFADKLMTSTEVCRTQGSANRPSRPRQSQSPRRGAQLHHETSVMIGQQREVVVSQNSSWLSRTAPASLLAVGRW